MTADASILIEVARLVAQRYLLRYDEDIPCEQLVRDICDIKQGWRRSRAASAPWRQLHLRRLGPAAPLPALPERPERQLRRLEGYQRRRQQRQRAGPAEAGLQGGVQLEGGV